MLTVLARRISLSQSHNFHNFSFHNFIKSNAACGRCSSNSGFISWVCIYLASTLITRGKQKDNLERQTKRTQACTRTARSHALICALCRYGGNFGAIL